ncbi:MAG: carbon-nitrogen hydrolase family protein [Dethiobacteria bacterium]
MKSFQVASIQIDINIGHKEENLAKAVHYLKQAAAAGANLAVFPECALSGYLYDSKEEAEYFAESLQGPSLKKISAICKEMQLYTVYTLLERADNCNIYNTAVLLGPDGIIACYRKTHLPYLGVDRFVTAGENPYKIIDTPLGKIGLMICYDLRFPEPARILSLLGAQVILLPTNLSKGGEAHLNFFLKARACENRVFIISANRIGEEKGSVFVGRSQIVDPSGNCLAEASSDKEEIISCIIEPHQADNKRIIVIPHKYEMHIFNDRKKQLYGPILK